MASNKDLIKKINTGKDEKEKRNGYTLLAIP